MIPSETQLRSWSEEKLKKRQLVQIIASRHGKIHLSEIHFVFSEMDGNKIMEYTGPDSRIISPGGPGGYFVSTPDLFLDCPTKGDKQFAKISFGTTKHSEGGTVIATI
jgi:hypothetical protein